MLDGEIGKALWTAEDAAEASGGKLIGADSWIATGVSIDTRSLAPGELFVALTDVRDGHDFAPAAFAAGAAAALVSRADIGGSALLVVDDVLEGLRGLARGARDRSAAKRIAVTGSVGKTSVKEALALCLAPSGATHAASKSFNNHFGVPLTLARMPPASAYGVFEIGMNHRGEIAPLASLVRPHAAVITTIAPVHVEHLGSLAAIAEEKADIFADMEKGAAAIVPVDAPHADILVARVKSVGAQLIRFGESAACEARLISFEEDAEGSNAEADILGKRIRYRVGAPGRPWAGNALATLAAAAAVGADLNQAAAALENLRAPAGRGAAKLIAFSRGAFTLVDDAYNASPVSIAAALETLGKRPAVRRIAALGDMLELGPDERAYHAALAAPVERAGIDLVFCAGPRMAALWEALPPARRGGYANDADSLIPLLTDALKAGDAVLVKGSFGSKMSRVVEALARLGDNNSAQ
ncbi:MAG: UDP-N-acetylmuramoyl-tripeptide--D-alanyl-D-alanine ligase [Pseudomonadota bacterium]